jgi:hypothetical protein
MKKFFVLWLIIECCYSTAFAGTVYVCQQCSEYPHYSSITTAISAAQPSDTIMVKIEDFPYYIYNEHLSIDKSIILTSDGTYPDVPIIKYDVDNDDSPGADEIISIESTGVTISNLIIENTDPLPVYTPQVATGTPTPAPFETNMLTGVGIRVLHRDCEINNCTVRRCRVGILVEDQDIQDRKILIDRCRIGDIREDDGWQEQTPAHPGNFFGIVQIESPRLLEDYSAGVYQPLEITNCEIGRNRYYGVVLRGGSLATLQNNLIVWNGTSLSLGDDNFGDGGVLSLFTAEERTATDVQIQSPLLLSNTIYGNDGFQICVLTRDAGMQPPNSVNAPLIMSNIIGPNPFLEATPEYEPPWLVSCATKPMTPNPTPEFGSAPYMAFNNVYREVPPGYENDVLARKYYYHPAWTVLPTSTPLFSPTPLGVTATPTPSCPAQGWPTPPWNSPTPRNIDTYTPCQTKTPTPPVTQTPLFSPTPAPTSTMFALSYTINTGSWNTNNIEKKPYFKGGTSIADFDFHLADSVYQPTPGGSPSPSSSCFNIGGFRLNPGMTASDHEPDSGQVDLGRHWQPPVPPVSNLVCTCTDCEGYHSYNTYDCSWTNPTHDSEGTLLDFAGILIYQGEYNHGEIDILDRKYLETCNKADVLVQASSSCTHLGVSYYTVQGVECETTWELIERHH